MRNFIKGGLIALSLIGAPLIAAAPAGAVDFSISLGNVAYGFSDGYWDRDHKWHKWHSSAESRYYRTHFAEHYQANRHDHDRKDHDHGWRNDHWWDHH